MTIKAMLLTLPLIALPSLAMAEKPTPFIGFAVSAGETKMQISRKRVVPLHLQSYGGQAGLKWKYARATVNYDWLSSKLGNSELISGTIAAQYPIGRVTPFVGVGVGYTNSRKQGKTPVYIATLGAEYAIDARWSIEAKYRYIHPIQHSAKPANIATIGINFVF